MTTYQRRARWIRRMQERASRRREREWLRQVGPAAALWGLWPSTSGSGWAA